MPVRALRSWEQKKSNSLLSGYRAHKQYFMFAFQTVVSILSACSQLPESETYKTANKFGDKKSDKQFFNSLAHIQIFFFFV